MRFSKAALNINWSFKGPDDVGSRTRAVVIDRNNSNHILAGGVAGGVLAPQASDRHVQNLLMVER